MGYKISQIIKFIEDWAKPSYQESWDNSGWQILTQDREVEKVLLALDLTDNVVDKAIKEGANLIITHHPLFFDSVKNIKDDDYIGNNIIKLIQNNISLYSAHTSMDIAEEGVNDTICDYLGLEKIAGLEETDKGYYLGNIAKNSKNLSLIDIYNLFDKLSDKNEVGVYGRAKDKIDKIAICGGSGFSLFESFKESGADLFITADIKHHQAQQAYENNLCIMDIGHHNGEKLIINKIKDKLEKNFSIDVLTYLNNDYKITINHIENK